MRILCIEDEQDIRNQISEELQEEGYEVLEASDGLEALEKIQEHEPDLVISDISMPRVRTH